jgi:hypothetical protein
MAKKVSAPEAPVVTNLPLPNSDNAMVIDLPDGQKLVVGKMETGTVIEVATWRGTGRPDSRTTRLMLGVSSQEKVAEPNSQTTEPAKSSKLSAIDNVKSVAITLAKTVLARVSKVASKAKKFKVEKPSTSPTLSAPISSVSVTSQTTAKDTDTEVQAWLDSIIAKSEKKEAAQATIKPVTSAKKAAPKSAPAKKSAAKKASTTRRAR